MFFVLHDNVSNHSLNFLDLGLDVGEQGGDKTAACAMSVGSRHVAQAHTVA